MMTETIAHLPSSHSRKLQNILQLTLLSFRVQWPFYILAAAYALTTYLLLMDVPSYKQAPVKGLVMGIITFTLPAGLVAVFLFRLLQYVLVIKPDSPVKQMGRDIGSLFNKPAALITGLPLLAAMVAFNKGMLELKPMIPLVKPFSYDETFMALDRSLHFGVDPWVWLQPVLGHDLVTFGISIAYNFWFLALFGTFMWFGFARQATALRSQFFIAYMLCWWIGGGMLAVYFSSAGPVYYSNIGLSPDPFTPLMSYLNDVDTRWPIWSLFTQQALWDGYTGKGPAIGIAAFPSMHNASSVLYALAAWRLSKLAGWIFTIYAGIILLGSVHLGWHYAVDGYAAILLALACWWIAGLMARWHDNRPSTRRLNEALAAL
jgi:PAP2 superfamily